MINYQKKKNYDNIDNNLTFFKIHSEKTNLFIIFNR